MMVRCYGLEFVVVGSSGIERYYFLFGDWVMVNEVYFCVMILDGIFLCL